MRLTGAPSRTTPALRPGAAVKPNAVALLVAFVLHGKHARLVWCRPLVMKLDSGNMHCFSLPTCLTTKSTTKKGTTTQYTQRWARASKSLVQFFVRSGLRHCRRRVAELCHNLPRVHHGLRKELAVAARVGYRTEPIFSDAILEISCPTDWKSVEMQVPLVLRLHGENVCAAA